MPITIPAQPFTFASESGNQPAAQLDSSFANIRSALTGIALQASDLIGSYGVRGLLGANNAGTPNSKYDLSADLVVLRNPSGGLNVQTAVGVQTNDVGLAGSAAGGRDQAGAFGASSYIHFYFIWSGTTLSTVSSAVAPPTGPTLPSGYTHWAYAGSVFFTAGSILTKTRMRGAMVTYDNAAAQLALNAGAATVETSVSLTTFVPSNALRVIATIAASGGTAFRTRIVTGVDFSADGTSTSIRYTVTYPNVGQNIFYIFDAAGGSGFIIINGYIVPNGGE